MQWMFHDVFLSNFVISFDTSLYFCMFYHMLDLRHRQKYSTMTKTIKNVRIIFVQMYQCSKTCRFLLKFSYFVKWPWQDVFISRSTKNYFIKPKGDDRMHQIKQIVKRILEIRNIFKTWSCSVLRRPLDKLYEGYFQSSLQTIQTLL